MLALKKYYIFLLLLAPPPLDRINPIAYDHVLCKYPPVSSIDTECVGEKLVKVKKKMQGIPPLQKKLKFCVF